VSFGAFPSCHVALVPFRSSLHCIRRTSLSENLRMDSTSKQLTRAKTAAGQSSAVRTSSGVSREDLLALPATHPLRVLVNAGKQSNATISRSGSRLLQSLPWRTPYLATDTPATLIVASAIGSLGDVSGPAVDALPVGFLMWVATRADQWACSLLGVCWRTGNTMQTERNCTRRATVARSSACASSAWSPRVTLLPNRTTF
jgi:hypothetical protein